MLRIEIISPQLSAENAATLRETVTNMIPDSEVAVVKSIGFLENIHITTDGGNLDKLIPMLSQALVMAKAMGAV